MLFKRKKYENSRDLFCFADLAKAPSNANAAAATTLTSPRGGDGGVRALATFNADGELTLAAPSSSANEGGSPVLVVGVTSRLEALDMGLRRAGRFDKEIAIGM